MTILIDTMIFAGAALMVWNIMRYNKYMKSTMEYGDWEGNRAMERADSKRIPIIALTANAFDEDVNNSIEAGMNAHLSKPVEPEKLFEMLASLIHRY